MKDELENSTEKLNVKFMTRQLLLMTNIIERYWEEVELELWFKLDKTIATKIDQMNNIISEDDGPKRKEKARKALIELIDTLRMRIDRINIKTA